MTHLSNQKGLWIVSQYYWGILPRNLTYFMVYPWQCNEVARWRRWASLCSVSVHKTAERAPLTSYSARQQWQPATACLRTTFGLDTSGHREASREAWLEPPWKRKQRFASQTAGMDQQHCTDKNKEKTPCLHSVKPFRTGKKARFILRFTSVNTLANLDCLTAYSFYIFQSECPRLHHEAHVLNNTHILRFSHALMCYVITITVHSSRN